MAGLNRVKNTSALLIALRELVAVSIDYESNSSDFTSFSQDIIMITLLLLRKRKEGGKKNCRI